MENSVEFDGLFVLLGFWVWGFRTSVLLSRVVNSDYGFLNIFGLYRD